MLRLLQYADLSNFFLNLIPIFFLAQPQPYGLWNDYVSPNTKFNRR